MEYAAPEGVARLAGACRARGLVATVLLAATHERIAKYRYPLPTAARLEQRAILVASAQRGGLYANLTRIAWLDEPDPEVARRQTACLRPQGLLQSVASGGPGHSPARASKNISSVLREAEAGQSFTVTVRGRAVARVVPAGADEPRTDVDQATIRQSSRCRPTRISPPNSTRWKRR